MGLEHDVRIAAGAVVLEASLAVPDAAVGVVLFAHGSGSGRHSPRNRYVAGVLQGVGLATVLADLLTADEETADLRTRHLRFDVPLLAERVTAMVDWAEAGTATAGLPVGLFGASTGAAAALVAAANRPRAVGAVVSRGGRPDLAGAALGEVRAPTLLVVGKLDEVVIGLNRKAMERLHCETRLEVVPGASHLFEEPGTLEKVAAQAGRWFLNHLGAPGEEPPSAG